MRLLAVITFLFPLVQSLAQPCCTAQQLQTIEAVDNFFSKVCEYFVGKVPIFAAEEIFKTCEEGITAVAIILELTGIGIPEGIVGEIVGTIICGAVAVGDELAGNKLCDFTTKKISALGGLGCDADCTQCPSPCIGSPCGSDETCVNGCCIASVLPTSSTTTTSTTTTTTSSCSTSLPATITCPSGSTQPTVVPCSCCLQNLCSQHPIQCGCLCDCSS